MKLFRDRYEFRSPVETDPPVIIKAYSERGAWDKFERWVVHQIYGTWALSYDAAKVRRIMRQVKCRLLPKTQPIPQSEE